MIVVVLLLLIIIILLLLLLLLLLMIILLMLTSERPLKVQITNGAGPTFPDLPFENRPYPWGQCLLNSC